MKTVLVALLSGAALLGSLQAACSADATEASATPKFLETIELIPQALGDHA